MNGSPSPERPVAPDAPQGDGAPLVVVDGLSVCFESPERSVYAVNGVSFTLRRGEVLGILGESGSGKSVTLRALMRLLPRRRVRIGGRVLIGKQDIFALEPAALADLRGKTVAMIFQEPMVAFDPVYSIGWQITETIRRHDGVTQHEAERRAVDLLERVRIPSAGQRLKAYPHELSGGMRQRAMIALALCCRPSLLLADEPTTALDATVQIQILLLLRELQRELGMAMIFVTHDVGAAVEISDRLAVMYAGQLVETGPVRSVIHERRHPYTEGLLASTVHGSKRNQRLEAIPGSPPSLASPPDHCSFAPRCRYASTPCRTALPGDSWPAPDHGVRCFKAAELLTNA